MSAGTRKNAFTFDKSSNYYYIGAGHVPLKKVDSHTAIATLKSTYTFDNRSSNYYFGARSALGG
jgi:hypothetical protein